MPQAATLSAGTASARPKESHGAVPGRCKWGRCPRLCQAWCGRDARAPRKPSSHDIVTPRAQNCRSILVPLVVEAGPSVFWSICVYSCPFVVRLHQRSAVFPRMIRPDGRGAGLPEIKPVSLSNDPPCRGGRGPGLSETIPGVRWRETGSKSSMSRFFIYMDGQDRQDYLARGFTVLSSTIAYASTRIPKTRSQVQETPQTHTRSLSESTSPAAAFYPVYPCSLYSKPI